jgi:MYXO-CTERM domain-containing protein
VLAGGVAQAHITIDSPTARYVYQDAVTPPCGDGTPTTMTNPPIAGGSNLTVTWHEIVNHDGHYRIGLSANESDFTIPDTLAVPSPLPSWDLMDGIPDVGATAGSYTRTITVPNVDCPHCVLQIVQIAATSNDGSNSGGYYTNYYTCADITITASPDGSSGSGGQAGGGGGSGGCSVAGAAPSTGGFWALLLGALALLEARRTSRRAPAQRTQRT